LIENGSIKIAVENSATERDERDLNEKEGDPTV
jgi:hypothetical protein